MDKTLPTVCQVLHSLTVGGAEVLAREYATQAAGNFNTVFACLDEVGTIGDELRQQGYVVTQLGRRAGVDYRAARRLARFCRKHDVDLIHAHQYTPFFYASFSRGLGGRMPVLFTEHGRHFPDLRRPRRVFANQFLLKRQDRVVAVGEQVKQALVDNEGIPASRIQVIYNGIDINAFRAEPKVREAVRRELGLEASETAVLQVARLNALKDHATAVRAMAQLKDDPSIRLYLVGDGEERGQIERMIAEANLSKSVTMLGLRTDVQRLMSAADMFLLTSVSEGIPLTLIEAMATSVPCVATNVGGIAEVVVDGETGLLSSPGDETSIAASIRTLARQEDTRRRLGIQGRARAERLFSDTLMHAAYQDVYRDMVANGLPSVPA